MQVEMYCPSCVSNCHTELDEARAEELIDRLAAEGPWFALGDGGTVEDELCVRLQEDGLQCPSCGGPVDVMPTSLGRLSLQLLTQW